LLKRFDELIEAGRVLLNRGLNFNSQTQTHTHKGEFQGVAATGKKVRMSGTNVYRFEEGRIAEAWQLYDVAGFLRQIGALTT